ncbi:MAG TPA: glycosyltransferase, partial [Flavobacterium sp.]|nr:glycosyltransferase [Flavobacterium sp.]
LRKFVIENKVEIIHAHSTSFFIAFLLKLAYPTVKLFWHDHYGARVYEQRLDNLILYFSSLFFSAIFVVNKQLEVWARNNLFVKQVFFIPNFATSDNCKSNLTVLNGVSERRIVCLANLKNPKNHIALLEAFEILKLSDLGWSLHLIGKDYNNEYSDNLKNFIKANNLINSVFLYNSRNDIQNILSQASIGVLCSTYEGFPVALLEFGLAKLAVVSTNVGYCSEIVKENFSGLLFDPLDINQIQSQLLKMVLDQTLRDKFALNLNKLVLENYSTNIVVKLLVSKYNNIN